MWMAAGRWWCLLGRVAMRPWGRIQTSSSQSALEEGCFTSPCFHFPRRLTALTSSQSTLASLPPSRRYGITINEDVVMRAVYYKYLYPKEAFVQRGAGSWGQWERAAPRLLGTTHSHATHARTDTAIAPCPLHPPVPHPLPASVCSLWRRCPSHPRARQGGHCDHHGRGERCRLWRRGRGRGRGRQQLPPELLC